MSVFALDTEGATALAENVRANSIPLADAGPSFFENFGPAVDQGVMRGAAKTGEAFMLASAAINLGVDKVLGTHLADDSFRLIDEIGQPAVDYWTPAANSTGTAGRIIGGLSEMVAPLAAGGGNPSLLMGTAGLVTSKDLVDQGVDAQTAATIGTTEALATGIGFKLPFLGKTLAAKMATGAGGNLALGVASTAANEAVLKSQGYEEQAKQFNPFNAEARTVDLLSGLAFGGLTHLSVRDAALTANNAKHFQQDTAPGIPADTASSVIHQSAIESALRDLDEGTPVTVPESVANAEFIKRPPPESVETQLDIAEPAPQSDFVIPSDPALSAADRAIESRFTEQVQRDPEAAMRAYAKLEDSASGKILNTDIARELSPDYIANRTKSAAVHEPASAVVKAMYVKKLAESPKRGEKPLVVFSAGGTGAGKTTGLDLTGLADKAQIVYDSNLNSLDSATNRIEQALAAGKDVKILYTYRDPVEALTGGALPRAMRQEGKFGSGRTVPLKEHAKTHVGSAEVLHQLAEKYANHPRVDITVVDNSKGKGKAVLSDLSAVPKKAHTGLEGKLNEAIDTEFKAGRISEAVYRGFKGEAQPSVQDASGKQGIQSPTRGRDGKETQSGDGLEPTQIETAAAEQALAVRDFDIPTGEIDADGRAKTVSARELMARAKEEIKTAKREATAFEAAVTCFLGAGA